MPGSPARPGCPIEPGGPWEQKKPNQRDNEKTHCNKAESKIKDITPLAELSWDSQALVAMQLPPWSWLGVQSIKEAPGAWEGSDQLSHLPSPQPPLPSTFLCSLQSLCSLRLVTQQGAALEPAGMEGKRSRIGFESSLQGSSRLGWYRREQECLAVLLFLLPAAPPLHCHLCEHILCSNRLLLMRGICPTSSS